MKDKEKEISVEDIRYFRFGMWFMLACFVVTGISVGLIYLKHTIPLPNKNSYTIDETKLIKRIVAGEPYYIPQNYLYGMQGENGFFIKILMPDLEPRTEENLKYFTTGRGWKQRAHVNISDKNETTTLYFKYDVQLKHYYRHKALPEEYGLIKQLVSRFEKGKHSPRYKYMNEQYLYTERDSDGDMVSYIQCEHLAPNPGCFHTFDHGHLEIRMSYGMDYLPQWKQTQSKLITLIESFKSLPKTSLKGDKS